MKKVRARTKKKKHEETALIWTALLTSLIFLQHLTILGEEV